MSFVQICCNISQQDRVNIVLVAEVGIFRSLKLKCHWAKRAIFIRSCWEMLWQTGTVLFLIICSKLL